MPRVKKSGQSKKSKKIIEEEDDDFDQIIEEDEPVKKKSSRKSSKSKKEVVESSSEDDLSDLDINESDAPPRETHDNDVVVNSRRDKQPVKIIDPETPIGELKTDEILNYLINEGDKTLNPQLKFGALKLLKQLTGKWRSSNYTSKRGYDSRRFSQRGGRGTAGRSSHRDNQRYPQDLYDDA